MHNYIYQLSKSSLEANAFICEDSFEPQEVDGFSDYLSDIPEEEFEDAYSNFPFCPNVFSRRGNKLTYKGCDRAFRMWHKMVCDLAGVLSEEGLKDSMNVFRLRRALRTPFTEDRFVLEGYDDTPEPSSDFLQYCSAHLEVGDTLYLGGVVDFHW